MRTLRLGGLWLGGLTAAMLLVGCGSGGAPSATSDSPVGSSGAAAGGPVSVVASTNVWGDVVEQIGGEHVDVRSIISDPSADPHSYEANAQNQLALSKAQLVVENGGGYDDFVDTMLAASDAGPTVINAVEVSGKKADDGEELNEHVWYDFPTVQKVAEAVSDELSQLDPADTTDFEKNLQTFTDGVGELTAQVDAIKAAHAGAGVAITEPVPLYLLEAAGLENMTPEEFSEAIENETDVPAPVLQQTLALFSDHAVKALVYNEQTTGPQTEAVLTAATDNSVAVVPVQETLPAGKDYLTWMQSIIQSLSTALNG